MCVCGGWEEGPGGGGGGCEPVRGPGEMFSHSVFVHLSRGPVT